jgi:hypothetical protein
MNYPVQLKLSGRPENPQAGIVFVEQMILPTLELCKKLEAENKIIVSGPLMETTVTPLSTFDVRIQVVRVRFEQMKGPGGAR